jgi:hypothetical protein
MRSICDFNLSTSKPRNRTQSSNEVGVVINNHVNGEAVKSAHASYPQSLSYPSEPPSVLGVMERSVEVTEPSTYPTLPADQDELDFYKELALTFAKMLKDFNPKLIANLIDTSGKIIIDPGCLCRLISLITHSPLDTIHIEYRNESGDGGCMAKVKLSPFAKVEGIKINHIDFQLGYNEKFNILADTFSVSLKKVYVGIEY